MLKREGTMQNVHSAIDALPDAGVLEDMGTKKQKLLDALKTNGRYNISALSLTMDPSDI